MPLIPILFYFISDLLLHHWRRRRLDPFHALVCLQVLLQVGPANAVHQGQQRGVRHARAIRQPGLCKGAHAQLHTDQPPGNNKYIYVYIYIYIICIIPAAALCAPVPPLYQRKNYTRGNIWSFTVG